MNIFLTLLGLFLVYCGICAIKFRRTFGIFRFEGGNLYRGKYAVFEGIIMFIFGIFILWLIYFRY
ncbi:MAG: hypothetical protein AAB662_00585 [Patescibacteria group bacterium]